MVTVRIYRSVLTGIEYGDSWKDNHSQFKVISYQCLPGDGNYLLKMFIDL
jgi:hypothetical protein